MDISAEYIADQFPIRLGGSVSANGIHSCGKK